VTDKETPKKVEVEIGSIGDFRLSEDARIEFNIDDETGLHLLANAEGWRELGRWCLHMADEHVYDWPQTHSAHSDFELSWDFARSAALEEGRVVLAFWGMSDAVGPDGRDVFFHKSSSPGSVFWADTGVKSGNSPGTTAVRSVALAALEPLTGQSLATLPAEVATVRCWVDTELVHLTPGPAILYSMGPSERAHYGDMLVEITLEDGLIESYGWVGDESVVLMGYDEEPEDADE
jgi:hypothetical protein